MSEFNRQRCKKIIIENSSDKNLFEELNKEYANIECFATGENFGMGKANNIGIQKVRLGT